MTTPIRCGIVGAGPMAASFIEALKGLDGAVITALATRDAGKAGEFARGFGIPKSYGSADALFDDPDVDVVYIATSNPSHKALCLGAIDAGKAVLCEKPFAINAAEAREVVERARARRVFCMEAMWTRFLPASRKLKAMIDEGAIGEPRILSAQIGYPFDADASSRQFDPAQAGGALLDLGVYALSMASFLFGPPEEVIGRASRAGTGVDEGDGIILTFPNGRLAVLAASLSAATPNEAIVMGTAGRIRVHEPFYRPHRLTVTRVDPVRPHASGSGSGSGRLGAIKKSKVVGALYQRFDPIVNALRRRGGRDVVVPHEGNGYGYQAAEVIRCLRAGEVESPRMPLDESVHILEAADALRASWGLRYPGE